MASIGVSTPFVCVSVFSARYLNKYASGIDIYPHVPILRPHASRFHERRVGMARALADSSDFGLPGEQSSPKICDCLPRTPMSHRAKCDAASFILGGEIRIRTNTHTQTNTVHDISTPCLSACVDKNRCTDHQT